MFEIRKPMDMLFTSPNYKPGILLVEDEGAMKPGKVPILDIALTIVTTTTINSKFISII